MADQANKYKAIFKHAMDWNKNHPNGPFVSLVQVWGPNDNNSWVGTDKSSGRSNAPLLYNGSNQPKEAYSAITSLVSDSDWGTGIPYTGPRANGGGTYTPPPPPEKDSNGYWFHSTFEGSTDSWNGRGSASVDTSSSAKAASKSIVK